MCPFCKEHDGKACALTEAPDGRITCACGLHSWPSSAVLEETCRRLSLTMTRTVHDWTQSL